MDALVDGEWWRSSVGGRESVVDAHADDFRCSGEESAFAIRGQRCPETRVRVRIDRIVPQLDEAPFCSTLGRDGIGSASPLRRGDAGLVRAAAPLERKRPSVIHNASVSNRLATGRVEDQVGHRRDVLGEAVDDKLVEETCDLAGAEWSAPLAKTSLGQVRSRLGRRRPSLG